MIKNLILFLMFFGCTANAAIFQPEAPVLSIPPAPSTFSETRFRTCKDVRELLKTSVIKPTSDSTALMSVICDGNPKGVVDIASAVNLLVHGLLDSQHYYALEAETTAVQKMNEPITDLISIESALSDSPQDQQYFSTSAGAR
jgi:hypothetical protein